MLIHCPNQKMCNTTREHKLNIETNDVICLSCSESNNNVSDFIKNAMKSNGDIYRTAKAKKAFTYKCSKCGVERSAKIIDEKAVCSVCLQSLNLAAPTVQAIKNFDVVAKDVDASASNNNDVTPKAEFQKGVVKRHKE